MNKSHRLGTALTAASLIAIVAGCAGPGNRLRSASIFGGKVDTANIGLATKAQMALASNDVATAIPLAERAVERSPNDAGFRALLGNCYLAAAVLPRPRRLSRSLKLGRNPTAGRPQARAGPDCAGQE